MSIAPIQWDHWRSFIAVAEHGSLSAAARALGLTQPTISRHVDLLEASLGATLFLRAPQGMTLSDLGQQMLPEARAMAASAAALERAASAPLEAARGVVRLGASEVVGAEVLPALLAPLLADHPGLEVELALSNHNDDLLRREADLALRMVRPTQSGLVARKLADVQIGLHAHSSYLNRHGTPETLDDLADHVLIGPDSDAAALEGFAQAGIPRRRICLRCDREAAQLNAIRTGVGIGVMQAGIARRDPDLRPVLAGKVAFTLECWLVLHADLRQTARVRLLADHLAEHLPQALAG
ncbi:LysR family transcriptional regulator [Pararhodobacter sp. SW119]|uniref:LysR family transcriptional regulator n=1 Tax=Pararhodobacter sp. SW119 TaxID=2780075 RepID=UPI001AE05730|nr:LysR family transcriptional regulator [Pararhodobacter sp. SW119]